MDSRIYILTHKRLTNQLSHIEAAELDRLNLIPENQTLSEEISYLWNVSNNYFPSKDWKKNDAKQAFMQKIKSRPPQPVTSAPVRSANLNWARILGVAASVLLLGWAISSFFNQKEVIKATNVIEYAEIIDDTKVWLDRGASLTVLEESDTERRVALVGEAIFDVSHNPDRPFTIDLGDNVFVEVLGTSFRARSTHDGTAGRISVREGKVRMYSTDSEEYDIILTSGEVGEFDPSYGPQRSKAVMFEPLLGSANRIVFKDTPLYQVFDELGLHFGVSFIYEKDNVLCPFSANIPDENDLDDILGSLEESFDGLSLTISQHSKVEVNGTCR